MINPEAKLNPKLLDKDVEQKPTRDGYGEGLVLAGKENPDIVVLCADLSDSTRSGMFQKEFPDRFIECGIAEQNMMDVAAGLALAGKVPFVSTYAVFCPGLNWSQIRVSVLQNDANVKITGAHAGVSVGPDGMSHQGLEDIAITRCLPGLTIIAPCDSIETKKATLAAAKIKGAVYLRFAREKTPVFTTEETPFEIGKALILRDIEDTRPSEAPGEQRRVAIIGCGPLLHNALVAAEDLSKEGIEAMVINCHTIKPLDEKTIIEAAQKCGAVVSVEEHQVMGGLGSAVAEVLAKNYPVPQEFIGVQNRWGESGEPDELIEKFGMGEGSIKEAAKKAIKRKKS
jgi:transketolase